MPDPISPICKRLRVGVQTIQVSRTPNRILEYLARLANNLEYRTDTSIDRWLQASELKIEPWHLYEFHLFQCDKPGPQKGLYGWALASIHTEVPEPHPDDGDTG